MACGDLRSGSRCNALEVQRMRLIAEAIICIVLMMVNRFVVGSRYEERTVLSMICMCLAIVVADLM